MKPSQDFISGIKYAIEVCKNLNAEYTKELEVLTEDFNDIQCIISGIYECETRLERRVSIMMVEDWILSPSTG